MDPLSVIASITGILAVSAKITKAATTFIRKERAAPASINHIITELSDLSVCLAHFQSFIQGADSIPVNQADLISVEQVVIISTSLVTSVSELDELLESFRLDGSMSMSDRLRWLRKESSIQDILARIRVSKESLNLMVTIFSW